MISNKSKLALALGVVGAIALSVPAAEARTKRSAPRAQHTITSNPFAYQAPCIRHRPIGAHIIFMVAAGTRAAASTSTMAAAAPTTIRTSDGRMGKGRLFESPFALMRD